MMLLGAGSSKPTDVYSNGSWISGLYIGPLKKEYKEQHKKLETTRRHLRFQNIHGFCNCAYKYIIDYNLQS